MSINTAASVSAPQDTYDLVCIGFGPASLAIAIALSDAKREAPSTWQPRVAFIEQQPEFRWHAGMLLPDTKMQISFLKDLATPRNPCSPFTFLSYLKNHNRLLHFANLGTFYPTRFEFEDYMKWCAKRFTDSVYYGQEVQSIRPTRKGGDEIYTGISVQSVSSTGAATSWQARNVVIAVGGKPRIPTLFAEETSRAQESKSKSELVEVRPHRKTSSNGSLNGCSTDGSTSERSSDEESERESSERTSSEGLSTTRGERTRGSQIIHSSQYAHQVERILPVREKAYTLAVVGSGQSSAEVFHDLLQRYPNASVTMLVKDSALRPSDDSPFVNEIFNPDAVDNFYRQPVESRKASVNANKNTNYGVVRPELLDEIYSIMYQESIKIPDESKRRCRILFRRKIIQVSRGVGSKIRMLFEMLGNDACCTQAAMSVDAVILATGYDRDAHIDLLKDCQFLNSSADGQWKVGRNYAIDLDRRVAGDIGIWLQGCNESTHGLSDSLLSILATRSGELLRSIFPEHIE